MDDDMLNMPAERPVSRYIGRKLSEFRSGEEGSMAVFVLLIFVVMLMFSGIAIDMMRFETRRVTMQEAMDRAVLASASLTQPANMDPKTTADDWFKKTGLGDQFTVTYSTPTVKVEGDSSQRVVTASSKVRSYNWFMSMSNVHYLEAPITTQASQGVSNIEVMLVLDVTGSMTVPASAYDTTTKIEALRSAAAMFVKLVKSNDKMNGVSIGLVPYSSQVNIPVELRKQFTNLSHISSWDYVPKAGVQKPDINCIDIPAGTFTSTGLPTTTPMAMSAVADIVTGPPTTYKYLPASDHTPATYPGARTCSALPDNPNTSAREDLNNRLFLPTKNTQPLLDNIARLSAGGNTSIALGMRWGTALIDQSARGIYTAIGDSSIQGRPALNPVNFAAGGGGTKTRKIIVLMTDGENTSSSTIQDAYKSGPSPLWRGEDGRYAMQFAAGLAGFNANARPACAGTNTYFVPHLKTGDTYDCQPNAWLASPAWSGSGTVKQLDWSEVWRYMPVLYLIEQVYLRSNVKGNVEGADTYYTLLKAFVREYISTYNMNLLLSQNCAAARAQGFEIYGIAFAAPANGQAQIKGCSSPDTKDVTYYHNARNNASLTAAFKQIATQIADLRLTQ